MKGYRFYLEYQDAKAKREGRDSGNVIALFLDKHNRAIVNRSVHCYEGYASVMDRPNSEVNVTTIDPEYLREKCKRISEANAKQIHPKLFTRIEEDEERECRYRETHPEVSEI